MKNFRLYEATATMVGSIIGAGILGIPYVVSQAGFLVGFINLVVLGVIVFVLYLYLGEIILRTPGKHQLTGYAERYLGVWGKRLMLVSMIFGIYGALIAYLLGVGQAVSALVGGNALFYSLIFFAIVATIIYLGIDAVGESELIMAFLILVVVMIISGLTFSHINISNLVSYDLSKIFLPYGVILFAYMGLVAIPEAHEILFHHKSQLKNAIMLGTIIPFIVYLLFTFVTVGAISPEFFSPTEPATTAMNVVLGKTAFVFANLFAIVAMSTSFIGIGFGLKEMFMYDYYLSKRLSWGLICFIPLFIALSGVTNFIQAIALSGAFAGGLESALVVLMISKAKKLGIREPEYSIPYHPIISILFLAVFIAGAGYVIWGMF